MTGTTQQDVQISFAGDVGKVVIDGSRFDVTPNSNVVAYTDQYILQQPPAPAINEGPIASIGKDFSVAVYGARITRTPAGFTVQAADLAQRTPLEQRVLEVGQRLRDGTVCIFVDPAEDVSLRVPGKIFAGWADFDSQDIAVRKANTEALNGHKDWGRITAAQGKILSDVWDKALLKVWQEEGRRFAPPEFEKQGWQDKDRPWFWLASPGGNSGGRVRRGGEAVWLYFNRCNSYPVPVVRSGPARSLDIQSFNHFLPA